MKTAECVTCMDRIADGKAVCDGSGVIAISDLSESRVLVCPNWPLDQDEPLAYWEAIDGLAYDSMPLTMQQRIRSNVMASLPEQERFADRHAPYLDEPVDAVMRSILTQTHQARDWGIVALALILCAFIFGYGIVQ